MWYLHDVIYTLPDSLCRLGLRKNFTGIWNDFLPDERYLFIHVPKNAGTLVSNSLYGHFINHYPVKLYRLTQPERLQSMRSFALLRDPATRFMSAIHHQLYQNHATPNSTTRFPHPVCCMTQEN